MGICGTATDEMSAGIVGTATASAGNDTAVCGSGILQLNGNAAGATSILWTSNGAGTFVPDDSTLNAVYIPAGSDTISGAVMLILSSANSCFAASDTMNVQFIGTPAANAGPDQAVCAGDSVALNGMVAGSAALIWTTTGSGNFVPSDTVASASYIPSPGDVANGAVSIVLTTSIGLCGTAADTLLITINPPVTVNAGNDTTVCASAAIQMNAAAGGTTFNHWTSSGTGAFSPNDSSLNVLYQPSPADTIAGSVIIILNGSNACFNSIDSVVVSFAITPSVNAGADQLICAGDSLSLNGTASVASGLQWTSSGTGIFFPNDTMMNAAYIPSAADITAGSVALCLTADTNICGYASDTLLLSISPSLNVFSGNDTSLCVGVSLQLNGTANGATSWHWTASGSGSFIPNDSVLSSVYQPAPSDSGSTLSLILSASNACFSAGDTMHVFVIGAPEVNAGADQSICAGDTIALNGAASSANTVLWSTAGAGGFIAGDTALNAAYIPGAGEVAAGSATLILSGMNSCMTVYDTVHVQIGYVPAANAGNDQTVCEGISVNLVGAVANGTGGYWTSGGNGTFVPSDTSLNALYIPAATDTTGVITIVLNPSSGSCGAIADTLQITVEQNPVAAFTHTPSCVNGVTGFSDGSTSVAGSLISWSWDFGSDTSGSQDPGITFASEGNQLVSLVVTTDAGCSDTVVAAVYVNPNPVALFTSVTSCPDSATFTDASSVTTGNIASWSWSFGDFSSGTEQHPLHIYPSPDHYITALTVTSDSGCSATFADSVIVAACGDDGNYQPPALPTAFTPNGDGHNDVLYVRGGPFHELDLRVYNEWGNEIFRGLTQAEGWDGTLKGEPQPGGKYIWTLKGISIHNDPVKLAGQIMLIRQ